jgi:hypothetical protein
MDDAPLKNGGKWGDLLLYQLNVGAFALGGARHFLHELEELT